VDWLVACITIVIIEAMAKVDKADPPQRKNDEGYRFLKQKHDARDNNNNER